MNNHIRAISDLKKENEENMKKYATSNSKRSFNNIDDTRENLLIRRYESITV